MQSHSFCSAVLVLAASTAPFVAGLNISTNDPNDLSVAVKQVANGVLRFYDGDKYGNAVGTFPEPYYWWEYGMAWDTLVNYWYLTGDASHNVVVQAALDHQQSPQSDYMPENQTLTEMNDDQAMWALAAMTAAERGFPLAESETPWEKRASNVFDELAARWDTSTCGGGLRWSIYTFNKGYTYKNSDSLALFFQLAARLARFTGNQTYTDWASRAYDWERSIGLIDPDTFDVHDGTSTTDNCTKIAQNQPSSFIGASFAYGSAILANITSDTAWSDRASSHLSNTLEVFFPANNSHIVQEVACEPADRCNIDQLVYPALTLRWLALLPVFQPAAGAAVAPALDASAVAAASQCTTADGGSDDDDTEAYAECTNGWSDAVYVERRTGLGQQLSALEALLARYVVERTGGGSGGGGVNASVVLQTSAGAGTAASSAGGGNGTESNDTSATTSGNAAATGANAAAGSVKASWGTGVLVAMAFAMACLL